MITFFVLFTEMMMTILKKNSKTILYSLPFLSFINHIRSLSFFSVERLFHKEKLSTLSTLEVEEEAFCK